MKEKTKVECRRGAIAALSLLVPMLLASCADLNSGPYADEPAGTPANWPQPTYFSVVVSMCCQTSDVVITSSAFRRLVMLHSVVAFFFNVIIIAITVNVVAGVL